MKKIISITLACAVSIMGTACHTTQKTTSEQSYGQQSASAIATDTDDNTRVISISQNYGEWNTMQCNGTFRLRGGKSFSSSVIVRMERDKSIFISLRPVLGIEVGRLVITGDSIIVIDKLHKRYVAAAISTLTGNLPATISNVQDLYLGRAFVLGKGTLDKANAKNATVTSNSNGYNITPEIQAKGITYSFDFDKNGCIESLNITTASKSDQTYKVEYDNIQPTTAGMVAHSIGINGTAKGTELNFELSYRDITWNKDIKIDTAIPSNYKKIELKSLNSLFTAE
ncbi:MAG: DUF4292 domain-containing protein [Bacteroidales bacterium]|nr:DUF4292 domain-containing protein [Candidatus Sodaliphilus aphodohippi]